ncbi:MAG: polyprenyl synthetase family protein, partial [Spirochaetaceae bacterium]|nr:polyprenyl synthetase family protein [Spirochaetaceae bacterium]
AGWARDGFEKRLLPESNPLVGAAEKLGLGFQILDDVKNLTGGIAGKKRGDDIVEGKKSLPVVLFVNGEGESGRETRAAFVMDYFEKAKAEGTEGQAAAELIARLEKTGALAGAEAEGRRILDEAELALSADYAADFPPPAASGAAETESSVAEARRLLSSFVGMLVR